MFTGRFARRMGTRYRKRGLDKTARAMVALLEQAGVAGATVLEIGGGARGIQPEPLARGGQSAANLELSPAYEAPGAAPDAEAGPHGPGGCRPGGIGTHPAAGDA